VLRWPLVGRFLRWRGARPALQAPLLVLGLLMVWQGLAGPSEGARNMATVFTWVHYRGVLVLALLVAGNLFCMGCPFMLPRAIARRFVRPVRHWPAALRNKWVAVALFVGVLFTYELFDLWTSPWGTAWLIVAYFTCALLVDSAFANASFCKYVCPLGQFNFVTSTMSPLTLQATDPAVCASCTTRDCINGTPAPALGARPLHRGCELAIYMPQKTGNLDCTLCLDCVHACPHDNIALTTRLPGSELWDAGRRSGIGLLSDRPDFTALVIVFVFGALLNAFAMITPVEAVEAWLRGLLGTSREWPVLSVLFVAALVVEPVLLLAAAGWLSRRLARASGPLLPLVARFSWSLVPLGVGVWAAHYGFHTLTGLLTFIPVAQAALGLGNPLWHLRGVPPGYVTPIGYGLTALGTFLSLLVAHQIAQRDFPARALRAAAPWAVVILLLGSGALWLLGQPMQMRGMLMLMGS
jgi:ferredoxin